MTKHALIVAVVSLSATSNLMVASQDLAKKPTKGKVSVFVQADAVTDPASGLTYLNASEIRESTDDLRHSLNENRWLKLAASREDAQIVLSVQDRSSEYHGMTINGIRTRRLFYTLEAVDMGYTVDDVEEFNATTSFAVKPWQALADRVEAKIEGWARENYVRLEPEARAGRPYTSTSRLALRETPEEPRGGKVSVLVEADAVDPESGFRHPKSEEIEESANDLRNSLKKSKWLELTDGHGNARLVLVVRGRTSTFVAAMQRRSVRQNL